MSRIMRQHIGRRVVDREGSVGVVAKFEDNHNIYIRYRRDKNGQKISGGGFYCQVRNCDCYDPLTLKASQK